MTAGIYVRFSSDKQNARSLEDQERNCRVRAKALGLTVGPVFKDAAVSGRTENRAGFIDMLRAAEAGELSVLMVDDLSRLGRNTAVLAKTREQLRFRNVRLISVSDGIDIPGIESDDDSGELNAEIRSIFAAQFSRDLSKKTHRGQTGSALRGESTGNMPYGYRSIQRDGKLLWEIAPEPASIVQRIFREYADGRSPKAIAADLNADAIASPSGGKWRNSAILSGNNKQGGILRNIAYRGEVIWNKSRWVRDPATGKRKRFERPESEWIRRANEGLRIIGDELWKSVANRLAARSERFKSHRAPGRKYLLSGFLRCGRCGSTLVISGSEGGHRYRCSANASGGASACREGQSVRRADAETAMLRGLKTYLTDPAIVASYCNDLREYLKSSPRDRRALASELEAVNREIQNLLAVARAGGSAIEPIVNAIREADARKSLIERRLAALGQQTIVPDAAHARATFDASLKHLSRAIEIDVESGREALRSIIEEVVPVRWIGGTPTAEVRAYLPGLSGTCDLVGSGGRIRTYDLRVMSPTSYQAAPPRTG